MPDNNPIELRRAALVPRDRPSSLSARFQINGIVNHTAVEVARHQGHAVEAAAYVRGAEHIGEEVMTSMDRLRRHEARSAAQDPVVADEYAAVRRAVLYIGLDEIDRYGRSR